MDETTDDIRIELSPKRVRVLLGGTYIVDTTGALLVWEGPWYPTYYLPLDDVRAGVLRDTGRTASRIDGVEAAIHDVVVGDRTAAGAALVLEDPPVKQLAGTVRLQWSDMDAWFEESEQAYVHPRDPYKRIDTLASDRHVVVEIDGTVVADSRRPTLLFETSLPTRYYLPKTDVRMDLLTPTDHTTRCPYKGTAEYYAVTVDGTTHGNAAWWYRHPTHESAAIAGLVCFYNERVDLTVDGERLQRPQTPFS
ncbi:MAG TPA: DUF427 domain-containing protein [Euzebyales bacterium]